MSEPQNELAAINGVADSEEHHDLLALLYLVQRYKIDWVQPTSQYWETLTAKSVPELITQFELRHKSDYTLKPFINPSLHGDFDQAITEIIILCEPSIRNCKRIIQLEAIVIDLCVIQKDDHVITNDLISPETIPSVLLLEKSTHGNLRIFLKHTGQSLSFESRLGLCADVANALIKLHDAHIIHGDVAPENIHVFLEGDKYVAKLTNFESSVVAYHEEDDIKFKNLALFWAAPERKHRNDKSSVPNAKRTDIFSFSMVCYWVLFLASDDDWEDHLRESKRRGFLHYVVKYIQSLPSSYEHKDNLGQFFRLTLDNNSRQRVSNLREVLKFITPNLSEDASDVFQPSASLNLKHVDIRHIHCKFQVCKSLGDLLRADHQSWYFLTDRLQNKAQTSNCEECSQDAAFQLAYCYTIGFGVVRNDTEALCWLEKSGRSEQNLTSEVAATKDAHGGYGNDKLFPNDLKNTNLSQNGQNYSSDSSFTSNIDIYQKQLESLRIVYGPDHPVVFNFRTQVALLHAATGAYSTANKLFLENLQIHYQNNLSNKDNSTILLLTSYITWLDSNQNNDDDDDDKALEYHKQALSDRELVLGQDHPLTLSSIYNMALCYQKLGNFQKSLKFFIQANEGYEKCYGSFHEMTLKAYKGVEEAEAEITTEKEAHNSNNNRNNSNNNDTDNHNHHHNNNNNNNIQNSTDSNRSLSRRSIGANMSPMNIMTNSIINSSKHEAGDNVSDLGMSGIYSKGHSFKARPILHPSRSSGVD